MPRPADLPDYSEPPLDEVVVGVQFGPIPGYTMVDSRAVWDLFQPDYPTVEQQLPLAPQFETFGGLGLQGGVQLQFGPSPALNRLWFVSADNDRLLQFQPDRFLTNWRKYGGQVPYPRYELIAEEFGRDLQKLSDHVITSKKYLLDINQAEITYINVIPVRDFAQHRKWLKVMDLRGIHIEGFACSFSEVVRDTDNKPFARLHHEVQAAASPDGKTKVLRLHLTFRGKPMLPGVDGALDFLGKGRVAIVNRFTELTTKRAHDAWGRVN